MTHAPDRALRDALAHLQRLQIYAERDLDDELVIDAICLRLSAGIEALGRIEPAELERLFDDDWSEMWGMRNRIAHGYLLVSADIVRRTIRDDVPEIIATIKAELDVASTSSSTPALPQASGHRTAASPEGRLW